MNKIIFYLFCLILGVQGYPEKITGIPGMSMLLLIPFLLVIFDTVKKTGSSALFFSRRIVSQPLLFSLMVLLLVFIFLACLRALFNIELFAKSRTVYIAFLWIIIPIFFMALRIRGFSLELGNRIFLSSLSLYLFVNLLLYLFGFSSSFNDNQEIGHAFLSGMLGLDMVRTVLPLSYDTGSGGAVAGLSMLGAIAGMLYSNVKGQKFLYFILLVLSLWAIFLTDSRGALFFGGLAILAVVLFPLSILRAGSFLLFLPLFFSTLLVALPDYMPSLLTSDDMGLSRGDSSLVTGREFIWNVVLDKLVTFEPVHLIGYGLNGQVSSGVSEGYLVMFNDSADYSEAILLPVHSNILQLILDIGYIGMFVYLLIFYLLFKVQVNRAILSGGKSFGNVMLLAGMLYLLLIGLMSVTLYYTSSVLIFSWFMMNLVFTVVDVPASLEVQGRDKLRLSRRISGGRRQ